MFMVYIDDYSEKYNELSFWEKLKVSAVVAGKEVIEKALILYYCLRDPDTPAWAKAVIVSSLGYFGFPLDLISDFIPVAGYCDDLATLTTAFATVVLHIKESHKEEAQKYLRILGFVPK
jgi:uncharacterized membrane protein YkvA (DUF1232 family)